MITVSNSPSSLPFPLLSSFRKTNASGFLPPPHAKEKEALERRAEEARKKDTRGEREEKRQKRDQALQQTKVGWNGSVEAP